jgi:hypothetical protein
MPDTSATDAPKAATKAAAEKAKPEPVETETPKTLNIRTCAVCSRTTAGDFCSHCGHDVSVPADREEQPLREPRLTRTA